jgi:hypothetical protein
MKAVVVKQPKTTGVYTLLFLMTVCKSAASYNSDKRIIINQQVRHGNIKAG